jgi:hypothetical protein
VITVKTESSVWTFDPVEGDTYLATRLSEQPILQAEGLILNKEPVDKLYISGNAMSLRVISTKEFILSGQVREVTRT